MNACCPSPELAFSYVLAERTDVATGTKSLALSLQNVRCTACGRKYRFMAAWMARIDGEVQVTRVPEGVTEAVPNHGPEDPCPALAVGTDGKTLLLHIRPDTLPKDRM